MGSIPGLGRSPGEGKGYPLQYSGLDNSMDCIVHGVTKSLTQLSDFHFSMWCLLRAIPCPALHFRRTPEVCLSKWEEMLTQQGGEQYLLQVSVGRVQSPVWNVIFSEGSPHQEHPEGNRLLKVLPVLNLTPSEATSKQHQPAFHLQAELGHPSRSMCAED